MITIGTRFYPAAADAERRQQHARDALLRLPGTHAVNLQFTDETFRPDGFDTRPVLRQDARTITGADGARKPIVLEMFDALAAIAASRGDRYFVYLNADIEVTADAVRRIAGGGRDGYAFCRVDLAEGSRSPLAVLLMGLDLFAIDVNWWTRERRRFRPYIAGEALWDNIYAAVLASHGNGEIVDADPGIRHEQHAVNWGDGPYATYNGYLAALDAPYFSRWAAYHAALESARATGGALDRDALSREIFGPPLLQGLAYPRHLARSARARLRYALARIAHR